MDSKQDITTQSVENTDEVFGSNIVLFGGGGTGKTYSIGTLVDTGIDVFYLAMESGLESLKGYYTDRGLEIPKNLHWHKVASKKAGFKAAISSAKKISTLDHKTLAGSNDPTRSDYDQWIKMLESLNNFVDDRTGTSYGAVENWGCDKALVIDGLTGMGNAAMGLVIGGKPVRSQADWGIAQNQLENTLRALCDDCPCHFVLIAHMEREVDQVMGGVKLRVMSLGQALSPKIPTMFSDCIMAIRDGSTWTWDTANGQADLKTRNLPISSKLQPSFAPIISKWKSRNGIK